jgi:formimidoylglutamate deiminase
VAPLSLIAAEALLPEGWRRDVRFDIDADGLLSAVTPNAKAEGAEHLSGPVLPGMGNLHSHAFQRGMAGLAEYSGPDGDNFWSWRQLMYRFLERLTPDDIEIIATQLYIEMLKAGYTAVGEFHYLHNAPDGRLYDDPAATAERILAAAGTTGIGLTLLPVLYAHGNFGGAPPVPGQRRFLFDIDGFNALVDTVMDRHPETPMLRFGIAPHSLRAVTPAQLAEAVAHIKHHKPDAPIHIHVAEQEREVADCVAWSGARPIEWLLDHADIDARWCFIHATHQTEAETQRLAKSGAVVGLCPSTEANLGDGIFPAASFFAAGGNWGIGTDSHIALDPLEELRLLEYSQRLKTRQRNILADRAGISTGASLYRGALAGTAQALAQPIGRLAPGYRADLVVLADDGTRHGDALLDAAIFGPDRHVVRDVMVGGIWRVTDRHHVAEEAASARYRAVLKRLLVA